MSQNRYKGIECDQCGRPLNTGLRLEFSVRSIYVVRPKGKYPIDDMEFYATFCDKTCLKVFLDKHYFGNIWEVEEHE